MFIRKMNVLIAACGWKLADPTAAPFPFGFLVLDLQRAWKRSRLWFPAETTWHHGTNVRNKDFISIFSGWKGLHHAEKFLSFSSEGAEVAYFLPLLKSKVK